MSPVCKSKHPILKFERDVHVHSIFRDVGALEQIFSIREPNELSIQPEVQREQSPVQHKKHILAFALHAPGVAARRKFGQPGSRLRLHRDGMENMHATNALALNQRAQCAYHSFYFGQFGHQRKKKSGPRLER